MATPTSLLPGQITPPTSFQVGAEGVTALDENQSLRLAKLVETLKNRTMYHATKVTVADVDIFCGQNPDPDPSSLASLAPLTLTLTLHLSPCPSPRRRWAAFLANV